jgi:hypothetical protein
MQPCIMQVINEDPQRSSLTQRVNVSSPTADTTEFNSQEICSHERELRFLLVVRARTGRGVCNAFVLPRARTPHVSYFSGFS